MGRARSLEGAKLKIDRSAEHLETLHQEVEVYLGDRSYEVVSEPRSESNPLLLCKVHRHPPLPDNLVLWHAILVSWRS